MPDLAAALRAVLPPGVVLAQGQDEPPWPGEGLPGAVPARLTEFALGRSAARAAIRALGLAPAAIPMGADRAPIWPAGIVGSISHCAGACFAIAGLRADYRGLGLDIEVTQPLDPDLWSTILRPEEIDTQQDPLQVFVAKEAAYKAQYAVTGQLFDFQTLSITRAGPRFAARFTRPIGPFAAGHPIHGQLVTSRALTAAICALTAT